MARCSASKPDSPLKQTGENRVKMLFQLSLVIEASRFRCHNFNDLPRGAEDKSSKSFTSIFRPTLSDTYRQEHRGFLNF